VKQTVRFPPFQSHECVKLCLSSQHVFVNCYLIQHTKYFNVSALSRPLLHIKRIVTKLITNTLDLRGSGSRIYPLSPCFLLEFENLMQVRAQYWVVVNNVIFRWVTHGACNFSLGDQLISEASSCIYVGIISRTDLNWAAHVNYTVKKAWNALHFIMRILKKGNSSTKSLAYTTLVRPILEYGVACWDPYRER